MCRSYVNTTQSGRSRPSSACGSPPAKRLRTSEVDDPDCTAVSMPKGSAHAHVMTPPSSMSQNSNYNQILMEGEANAGSPSVSNGGTEGAPIVGQCENPPLLFLKLLADAVNVEYGANLHRTCVVHLELLKDHSFKLRETFERAADSRHAHLTFNDLKLKTESLLPPDTATEVFLGEKEILIQAMNLIIECFNKLPLQEYQAPLRKVLENLTDDLFHDSTMWKLPGSVNRKDYPRHLVVQRLQHMKAEAVNQVTHRLSLSLRRIEAQEKHKATLDETKAAAQLRIILPSYDQYTVGSTMHWVYWNKLSFIDADHLCKIHSLADQLGIEVLACHCLDKLSQATRATISNARMEGTSLRQVLDKPQVSTRAGFDVVDPLADVVRTVFMLVSEQENAPMVLKQLVIEAIADSSDTSIIETLLGSMNSDMKGALCMALANRNAELKITTVQHNTNQCRIVECSDSSLQSDLSSPAEKAESEHD